ATEGQRFVEERQHLGTRRVDGLLVPLEAQNLIGVDRERQAGENLGVGGKQLSHYGRFWRPRTTSAMRRMWSGLEPQQAPTILQPASRSAGDSRGIASGPSSDVTGSAVGTGTPAV